MKLLDKLSRLSSLKPGSAPTIAAPLESHVEREPALSLEAPSVAVDVEACREQRAVTSFERGEQLSRLREQMEGLRTKLTRERERLPLRAQPLPEQHALPTVLITSRSEACGGLPGDVMETDLGPLRSIVTRYDEDHCHGSIPVCSALEASSRDLSVLALDPSLTTIDFARALYIDTETTGLAGGSGTIPFLIGMAWFEGRNLVVEQLLLDRPGLEGPMLMRLAERLSSSSVVVSFNGKSFDWPLLRTRFILQRIPAPIIPAHLDLLHCARRVYKRRLGSVRLVHLEEELLGFTRVDDIAGELIPQTYLGFVRGQVEGGALTPIVDHNRHDLVALSAMMGEISRRFRGEQPEQDARDQLGFAGVAARGDDHERAAAFARGAAEADVRGELAPEAHFLAGELCLRNEDVRGAERAFLLSVEAACGHEARAAKAHLALAKLYEHRLKRPAAALEHARRCQQYEGSEASQRRTARLARKLAGPTANLELEGL